MTAQNWSLPTRFLHLGLVATVSIQLFVSLIMDEPGEKESLLGTALFEVHEVVGLSALAIVLVHWAWSLFNHADGGLAHLFPWHRAGRQQVMSDIRGLMRMEMPASGVRGGLPGLIHGLGLLAVTGIALTGGMLFLLMPEQGDPGQLAEAFEELHEGFAALVWTYWIGHGGIAIMHHLSGHDTVRNMFNFSSSSKSSTATIEKNSAS